MVHELESRVRAMREEQLANGVRCNNVACEMRISCERFQDSSRTEQKSEGHSSPVACYAPDSDQCFVLRRRLQGTPDIHREWTKTTKRHRRKGGNWI